MRKLNFLAPLFTRQTLMRESQWKAPYALVKDLPLEHVVHDQRNAARDAMRRMPGLSYEQIRTVERYGIYDPFIVVKSARGLADLLFRKRRRRRGDPKLYSLLNIAQSRLVSWMLSDPRVPIDQRWTMREIALVLRSEGTSAPTMLSDHATSVVMCRWPDGTVVGCTLAGDLTPWPRQTDPAVLEMEYPLSWLGMGDAGPRLWNEAQETTVFRWNRQWTPAELHAKQEEEARELRA